MNKTHIWLGLALIGGLIAFMILAERGGDFTTEEDIATIEGAEHSLTDDTMPEEYVVDSSDMLEPPATLIEGIDPSDLTEAEREGLILMREEEKLARDVYQTLGDLWGMRIFSNIAASEQTHTNAMKVLLDRYEVSDPVVDDTVGVFTLPEMQTLYDELVAKGTLSLPHALTVGATIEDLDIKDLDDLMAITDNEDILVTYRNLQKGSRNHMRAFNRQINRQGLSYEPQYISQEDFEAIISGEQERGRI
jgi:hypothetical protein